MHREIWFESAEVPIYDILALHLSYIYKIAFLIDIILKNGKLPTPAKKISVIKEREI